MVVAIPSFKNGGDILTLPLLITDGTTAREQLGTGVIFMKEK